MAFTQNKMGSHWKVLSRKMIISELGIERIAQTGIQKTDCRRVKGEIRKSGGVAAVRDDSGLDQSDSSRSGEEWPDSGPRL